MIGLVGKKIGMTQIFDEQGHHIPVTVLEVGPCVVTAVRRKDRDGYDAIQLGFGDQKEARVRKSELGYFKKLGLPLKRVLHEIRSPEVGPFKVGDEVRVDNFEVGDYVDVEGSSIGKGFQGVVKRHHFTGGPKSHGSMFGRVPGSIGASSFPSRVVKGMRAAGHMGDEKVTVQNLKVVKVDCENNLLAVRGAVPGVEDGIVLVREALKRGKKKPWKISHKKELDQAPKGQGENASGASGEGQQPEPEAAVDAAKV